MSPLRLLLAAIFALTFGLAPAAAQEASAPAATTSAAPAADATKAIDYALWNRVAQRAEQAIEAGRASDQALASLRAELVSWREKFTGAKADNQVRITTLETQIATLGPKPNKRQTEPAAITQKRDELTAELDAAQAPVKDAELGLARANALIGEIDSTLRARQTDELFALGPSPANPANWPAALGDLVDTMHFAWSGVVSSLGTETQRAEFRANLPVTLLFAVLALMLILRGRAWAARAAIRVAGHAKGGARGVWEFLFSLLQLVAPLAGIYALVEALHYAGILGLRAQVIVDELPVFGLALFAARWLGGRLFGTPAGGTPAILNLTPTVRAEGRYEIATLGLLFGLERMLEAVARYESYSEASRTVLGFPIIAFAGFLLFRLGQVLRRHARAEAAEAADGGASFATRTAGLAGLALMLIALLAPVSAAVGYAALAVNLLFPTLLTAALVGTLIALHRFFLSLYAVALRTDEETAGQALLPVLASSLVILAMLPVLALIWGARVTDLTELWTRAGQGVTLGGTVISPSDLVTFAVIFALGFGATRLIQGMLKSTILPKTRIDLGGRNAITSGVGYIGIFLAAVAAITAAGINLSSLAIVAGALSVGIGFGLQNIVSNFVSGIILLIERPISEGDWIEVGGQMGFVRDISVRSTRIETFDRTDVILPNSDLISGVVTNYTRGNLIGRVIVPVGVAYGSDTRAIEKILMEVANDHPLVALNPPPAVLFMGFGASSLDFEIRAILRDVNFKLAVLSDMNHEIARRFTEAGIEVPFPQRDLWLRNPESLGHGHKVEASPGAAAAKPPAPDAEAARAQLNVDDMDAGHGAAEEDGND